MGAPRVPLGAGHVRGAPPSCTILSRSPGPPASLRFSLPWQFPQGQTLKAPGDP